VWLLALNDVCKRFHISVQSVNDNRLHAGLYVAVTESDLGIFSSLTRVNV